MWIIDERDTAFFFEFLFLSLIIVVMITMMMIIGDRFSAMTTDRKRIRGYENFTYVGTVDGTNDPRVFTKRGWRNTGTKRVKVSVRDV